MGWRDNKSQQRRPPVAGTSGRSICAPGPVEQMIGLDVFAGITAVQARIFDDVDESLDLLDCEDV